MPVTVNISPYKIGVKVNNACNKSIFPLASQVLGDCNQYVKIDQHIMEASSYTASRLSEGKIIWDTPYARRQYWAIQTSLTPGRCWKWCEAAKKKYGSDWNKLAEKLLRSNL